MEELFKLMLEKIMLDAADKMEDVITYDESDEIIYDNED